MNFHFCQSVMQTILCATGFSADPIGKVGERKQRPGFRSPGFPGASGGPQPTGGAAGELSSRPYCQPLRPAQRADGSAADAAACATAELPQRMLPMKGSSGARGAPSSRSTLRVLRHWRRGSQGWGWVGSVQRLPPG